MSPPAEELTELRADEKVEEEELRRQLPLLLMQMPAVANDSADGIDGVAIIETGFGV